MADVTAYMKTGVSGMNNKGVPRMGQFILDFSVTSVTQNDIVIAFQCPEDYVVFSAGYEILTDSTASTAMDVGKAGGTEMLSAVDLTAGAGVKGAGSMANPLFFKDGDTIDIQITGATPVVGKVRVWWVGANVTEENTVNDLVAQ